MASTLATTTPARLRFTEDGPPCWLALAVGGKAGVAL